MHDLVISDAVIVDGTGAPRRTGAIAVDDGRVVAVGDVSGPARRTIDAEGRVVAPGFIDVHTHYDAQGFWDTTLSPTPLHGVTTAIAGNCGFSIAPLRADMADYLMRMLARVEDIPIASLSAAVPWDWSSTAEFLDRVDGTLAINTAYMVGHSALRAVVMGDQANQRAALPNEVAAMSALLSEGLAAGGLGFSSTASVTHSDASGRPVPSRQADRSEFVALASICRGFPGTALELVPGPTGPFEPGKVELMTQMSSGATRPLNWNVMFPNAANLDECLEKLAIGAAAGAEGARIIALALNGGTNPPLRFRSFSLLPGLGAPLLLPDDELAALLTDPTARSRIAAEVAGSPAYLAFMSDWSKLRIRQAFDDSTRPLEGAIVGDLARQEGRTEFDVVCDIVLADRFQTVFDFDRAPDSRADWQARVQIWETPGSLVGGSDAGAHIERNSGFCYPTKILQHAVRQEGLLSLEAAVRLLSKDPADAFGLLDRGQIVVGGHADLVVLDQSTIGPEELRIVDDLPGGASRLYGGANGIAHVLVGGEEIVRHNEFTDERPGRVLRSGTDTRSPAMA